MEFFIFLILFLCVFLPSWNILCSATEYIRERQDVVTQRMDSLDVIYQRTSRIVNRVDERLRVSEYISYLKDLAIEYPITVLCTVIVLSTVALPVLTFIFFALATVTVTFVGFLFVNGTVITIGAVVFGGVILTFGTVAVGVGALVAAGYYAVSQVVAVAQRLVPTSLRPRTSSSAASLPEGVEAETNGTIMPHTNGHITTDTAPNAAAHSNGWEKVG